jgi:hypothetical protein
LPPGATVRPELGFARLDDRLSASDGVEPRLGANQDGVIDDPQIRDIATNPLLARIDPRHAPSGCWVVAVSQAIPGEAAYIKLVMENAGAAQGVAVDRGVAPTATSGSSHSLGVAFGRHPARTLSRGEIGEDATDHHGLINGPARRAPNDRKCIQARLSEQLCPSGVHLSTCSPSVRLVFVNETISAKEGARRPSDDALSADLRKRAGKAIASILASRISEGRDGSLAIPRSARPKIAIKSFLSRCPLAIIASSNATRTM